MIRSPAEGGRGLCATRPEAAASERASPALRICGVALALLAAVAGCSPATSSVPLGAGPLAVAEQDAEARMEAKRRSQKSAHSARPLPTDAPAVAEPVAKTAASDSEKKERGGDADDEKASAKASASGPAFEGMYAGADIAVFRLTGLPDREQRDDKAKIRIDKASGGNVSITLINSEDGSDLCELTARVDGHAALIETAQPCFSDGSEGSLEAQLTAGRAVVEGDRLVMNAEGKLSVALPDQELDGEMTYSFKGERQ